MRIKLKEGAQKKLILSAKGAFTWKELSKKIGINELYLCNELCKEKRLLSEELYQKLCIISQHNFDSDITQKLEDGWGQSIGGFKSKKNTKNFIPPNKNEELAEIIGIILGDGHLSKYISGNKIRVYCIRIAGNSKDDREYIKKTIPSLFFRIFKEKGSIMQAKNRSCAYFTIYGKEIVDFIISLGLKPGNKIKNNQGIPDWIIENKNYLKACIRGLIDTDGSVHLVSKENKNLRIDFKSHIPLLLEDVRSGLISLGYSPTKIIDNRHIFITRKEDILKYYFEIGFNNSKNLKRYFSLKNEKAPIV